MTTTSSAEFREMLRTNRLLALPGVYDGISARLSEQRGFKAIYMTGAGTAMSYGFPDFGLLTATEMAGRAGAIAQAVNIPLIADADTGYGNELNVTRTVRDYERGGVAGLHIEDQVSPKRCGHLDGKEIIPPRRIHLEDPRCGRRPARRKLLHHRPNRRARRGRL